MKQCLHCKREGKGPKPLSEFCKGSGKDGLQNMCREHTRAANRLWAKNNPEKNRVKSKRFRERSPVAARKLALRSNFKRNYGITEADYERILVSQNGRCAICGIVLISQVDHTRAFSRHPVNEADRVDHCHKTGRVRGILCFGCNVGLGKFRDDENLMLRATRYLCESATAFSSGRTNHDTIEAAGEPEYRDLDRSVQLEALRSVS